MISVHRMALTAVHTSVQSKSGNYKLCLLFNKLQAFFIFIAAQKARNLRLLNDLLSNNQHLLGFRGERTEELDSALIGKILVVNKLVKVSVKTKSDTRKSTN